MAVGDVLQARFITTMNEQMGLNIRHYRVTAEVAPVPSREEIAVFLASFFSPFYLPLMTSQARFRGVGVRRVKPLPLTVEDFSADANTPGTGGADALPRQVSGIITLRTALAGRKFRGRMYMPFPPEQRNTDQGVPDAVYTGSLGQLANVIDDLQVVTVGLGSISLEPVVYHRSSLTSDDITEGIARSKWATQRRRGSFGAANPDIGIS